MGMYVPQDRMTLHTSNNLLGLLRCPSCRGSLERMQDGYACASCRRPFPQERGVTRFVDASNYADSFGFQWQRYARTQLDDAASGESDKDFRLKTGFTPEDLKGKLVLDVGSHGCGDRSERGCRSCSP